jgi:hypothetical protein
MKRTFILALMAFAAAGTGRDLLGQEAPQTTNHPSSAFERAFAPLVQARCIACHGPIKPKAGLDLTRRELVLQAPEGQLPVVVAGKPDESLLLKRISDGSMPPEDGGPAVPEGEVARVHQWIAEGAPWPAGQTISPPQSPAKASPQPIAEPQPVAPNPSALQVNPRLADDPDSLRAPRRFRGKRVRILSLRCWRHCHCPPLIADH